jgi:uncharacterized protein (TIGR02001 family)
MKSIRTMALVTGLLAVSGVSQAQFTSTWTAVSDYDFRGVSQSAKDPAIQGSADYAFGDTGLAVGAWASNVDFDNDEDAELDLYVNYTAKINDTFAITTGAIWYEYPLGEDTDGMPEIYVGFNAGNFNMKQWYSWMYGGVDSNNEYYTEANYTAPIGDKFSLAFHTGYVYGHAYSDIEAFDFAIQANLTVGKFTIFAKATGTDATNGRGNLVRGDTFNNEPRALIGVTTTFPWGK